MGDTLGINVVTKADIKIEVVTEVDTKEAIKEEALQEGGVDVEESP